MGSEAKGGDLMVKQAEYQSASHYQASYEARGFTWACSEGGPRSRPGAPSVLPSARSEMTLRVL